MTTKEAKEYLNSYKDYADRLEYIENKVLNVHSTDFQAVKTSNTYHKNQSAYIEMKDRYLNKMHEIMENIEQLENMKHRSVLFYRYIESLNVYDIAEVMGYSKETVYRFISEATKEFAKTMTTGE